MKEKKVYIVLIIILFIFFIVVFSLLGKKNLNSEKEYATIIVGNHAVWKYENNKWLILKNDSSFDELSWKKYHVFSNQKELGDYYLWHDDKWYVFDDSKSAVKFEGELFAYSGNYNINIKEFTSSEVDDYTYVNQVLRDHDLSSSSKFTSLSKILFDIDNDNIEEEFYIMSNAFPLDFTPEYIFSFVFMVKDNQIYMIYDDMDENRFLNGCKPYITSFLDVNHDNKYEFILSCGYYSDSDLVDLLYSFSENQFKIMISNQ